MAYLFTLINLKDIKYRAWHNKNMLHVNINLFINIYVQNESSKNYVNVLSLETCIATDTAHDFTRSRNILLSKCNWNKMGKT